MMIRELSLVLMAFATGICVAGAQGTNQSTNADQTRVWHTRPLSMAEALDLALRQNGAILRGKSDLEAQYGVVVQTRAVAIPKVQATGNYQKTTATEQFPFPNPPPVQDESWAAGVQVVQAIYQGGQIRSALRTARLTKDQAVLQYRTVVADALLEVRITYYDVLSAAEQIVVEEASVKLLTQEFEDQNRRYQAGTVPRFNVLRAEVELANEKPKLIQARNAHRIAKNKLVNLLGYHIPPNMSEDVPLQLTDRLDAEPYSVDLSAAVSRALANRTELATLRKQQLVREEALISAKGGYKPTLELFGGYGARNTSFNNDLGQIVDGFTGGARVTWNIFDGLLTKGRVQQARALHEGAKIDVDNQARSIELEVRTDYSNLIEARETLESQKKVQEQAEEALRLAIARSEAGTGTQLDVLSARTSLTQAQSTQVQALRAYDVARARLERAMGINAMEVK